MDEEITTSTVAIYPEERKTRIETMKSSGQSVSDVTEPADDKGDLVLDGINKLIEVQNELCKIVQDYGKLILKDAGILKTISDNFESLDNSATNE